MSETNDVLSGFAVSFVTTHCNYGCCTGFVQLIYIYTHIIYYKLKKKKKIVLGVSREYGTNNQSNLIKEPVDKK